MNITITEVTRKQRFKISRNWMSFRTELLRVLGLLMPFHTGSSLEWV